MNKFDLYTRCEALLRSTMDKPQYWPVVQRYVCLALHRLKGLDAILHRDLDHDLWFWEMNRRHPWPHRSLREEVLDANSYI